MVSNGYVKHLRIKTCLKKNTKNANSYWKVVIMDDFFFFFAKMSKFFEMLHCFITHTKITSQGKAH